MKGKPSSIGSKKIREIEPFNRRKVELAKFKPDLSPEDFRNLLGPLTGDVVIVPFLPIETLSPTKTLGRGRTNLTIIMPTIVQIDAVTPYAGFNRSATPSRNPTIQMHFEPSAYGITSVANYYMGFTIEAFGQSTFNLTGGPVPVLNGGTKVLNGKTTVSLLFKNLPPSQQVFGYLEQTAGGMWNWYLSTVRFPPLVIKL